MAYDCRRAGTLLQNGSARRGKDLMILSSSQRSASAFLQIQGSHSKRIARIRRRGSGPRQGPPFDTGPRLSLLLPLTLTHPHLHPHTHRYPHAHLHCSLSTDPLPLPQPPSRLPPNFNSTLAYCDLITWHSGEVGGQCNVLVEFAT